MQAEDAREAVLDRGVSVWERIVQPGRWPEWKVDPSRDEMRWSAQRRTGIYEQTLRLVESNDERVEAECRALRMVHMDRLLCWSRVVPSRAGGRRRSLLVPIALLGVTSCMLPIVLGSISIWLLLALPVPLMYVGYVTGRKYRQCSVLRRRLDAGRCPACGYDITKLPQAIDPALLGRMRIGPRECSECGMRWPGVPSAV